MLSEIIYNFIVETVTGTEMPGSQSLAILLTAAVEIVFIFAMFKLAVWVFKTVSSGFSGGRWRE